MKFEIQTAKSAGFCFGVGRAVDLVYQALSEGRRVATLGPIVHNDTVVNDLEKKGARIVSSPSELAPGETLIIRAHGVPKDISRKAIAQGNPVIDATCPFVARIHRIVEQQAESGRHIFIAGDPKHPEVQGIVGHCRENCTVFQNVSELRCLISGNLPEKLAIVSQTTYNNILWRESINLLPSDHPDLQVFDTICNATATRQSDADQLSRMSDIMIVAGGRHSSNTVKLFDVSSRNCPTWLVENAEELRSITNEIHAAIDRIAGTQNEDYTLKIGITAGASTPASIIKEVQTICLEFLTTIP
ncbi:MAG: 4-hydroxy-3-methylbut-2-enyl diphosphate reductase [Oscillospiraceae bacterium]|nr:4-hydroxy-3-methylbut-2-enyl diphosphate reductase [Oscillospiraceae bacterium]